MSILSLKLPLNGLYSELNILHHILEHMPWIRQANGRVYMKNRDLAGLILTLSCTLTTCTMDEPAGAGNVYAPTITGRVDHLPIAEISGIAKSRFANTYWVHNDSGDEARLFAIDRNGGVIIPDALAGQYGADAAQGGRGPWPGFAIPDAANSDWEDISYDGEKLYIADFGNNANNRQDMAIYVVDEINPVTTTEFSAATRLPISYPEQTEFPPANQHFDSESLFFADGSLYLITKHRSSGMALWEAGANLYRLDTRYSDRNNPLTLIDSHPLITAATAAEVSPDGSMLAVLSYSALWLFDRPVRGDQWLSSGSRTLQFDLPVTQQIEAIEWLDNGRLIMTNEQRDLFEIPLTVFDSADRNPPR